MKRVVIQALLKYATDLTNNFKPLFSPKNDESHYLLAPVGESDHDHHGFCPSIHLDVYQQPGRVTARIYKEKQRAFQPALYRAIRRGTNCSDNSLLFIFEKNPAFMKLIVSVFALFVVTTAALQKFLLETKRKYEKEQFDAASKAKEVLIRMSERLSQRTKWR